MGTIKTTNIEPIADNGTVTLGGSGDTFTVPSGVTVNMSNATQTGVGGVMTPSFFAYAGANFNISEATDVKMTFNTELYDEGGVYNTSNGRFTPAVVGKYYIFSSIFSFAGSNSITQRTKIYKNGSSFSISALDLTDYYLRSGYSQSQSIGLIINVTSVNDYFEIYFHGNNSGDGNITINGNSTEPQSYFGAYKIIE